METKEEFYKVICDYYFEIAVNRIPKEYIIDLSDLITEYYYEQYQRFRIKYPKSIKRYSTFKMADLEHPSIYEMIINFFKQKIGSKYADMAKILLRKEDLWLKEFEKMMNYYHNK